MARQAEGSGGAAPVGEMPEWQLARRRRIVEAAAAALDEQDYEQIQMRDVAQSAAVALGTLYRYFSSKEHLYAEVLEHWATEGEPLGERYAELDVVERIRARVRRVVRAFERQPRYYKLQSLLLNSSDGNVRELLDRFTRSATAWLVDDLAVLGPTEAADVADMCWSIISTMLTGAVYRGRPMADVYRVCDGFVDLLVPRLRAAQEAGAAGP
ncbi:TetR/AcrR family transcriptional regulator [Pseudonocardia humida]|uniref:TetR/AcrR family transcriptional regulator n=1 Tax=Pseudonocardia humida TaxID=2800819 RepID=A0ABT1A9U2_9PSEU|nr:TetR family transcriptional regulator [Pseudonocardia humida]MCO1659807.1 TetR/AcrR family transcriptional regulator [Pseudonocardia humida]